MRAKKPEHICPIITTDPVTTLLDEGKFIRILTELPGIAEEKIKIDLENNVPSVIITGSDTGIRYKKVISIPCEVRFRKKKFSDGILELILEKINSETLQSR